MEKKRTAPAVSQGWRLLNSIACDWLCKNQAGQLLSSFSLWLKYIENSYQKVPLSAIICQKVPLSAIFDHYLPFSAIIFHYLPKCGKCPLPVWYICTVTCQRRSPFGSRSMFDRFPLVLRYSFVRPSFVLRSSSVRFPFAKPDVTEM